MTISKLALSVGAIASEGNAILAFSINSVKKHPGTLY
jgi:hypothetical protein